MNRLTTPLLFLLLITGCDGASSVDGQAPPISAGQNEQLQSAQGGIEQQAPDMAATMTVAPSSANQAREKSMLRDSYYKCVESSNGVTWDMQACVEEEFEYQDARLNTVYKNLQAKLPEAQKLRLRDDQRQWISDKDEACKWDAETEGQAQRIEANVCALKKTAIRADELEEMASKSGNA